MSFDYNAIKNAGAPYQRRRQAFEQEHARNTAAAQASTPEKPRSAAPFVISTLKTCVCGARPRYAFDEHVKWCKAAQLMRSADPPPVTAEEVAAAIVEAPVGEMLTIPLSPWTPDGPDLDSSGIVDGSVGREVPYSVEVSVETPAPSDLTPAKISAAIEVVKTAVPSERSDWRETEYQDSIDERATAKAPAVPLATEADEVLIVSTPHTFCPKCSKPLQKRGAHFHIRACKG